MGLRMCLATTSSMLQSRILAPRPDQQQMGPGGHWGFPSVLDCHFAAPSRLYSSAKIKHEEKPIISTTGGAGGLVQKVHPSIQPLTGTGGRHLILRDDQSRGLHVTQHTFHNRLRIWRGHQLEGNWGIGRRWWGYHGHQARLPAWSNLGWFLKSKINDSGCW